MTPGTVREIATVLAHQLIGGRDITAIDLAVIESALLAERAKERERCALVCLRRYDQHLEWAKTLEEGTASKMRWIDRMEEASDCAAAIRALSDTPTTGQD